MSLSFLTEKQPMGYLKDLEFKEHYCNLKTQEFTAKEPKPSIYTLKSITKELQEINKQNIPLKSLSLELPFCKVPQYEEMTYNQIYNGSSTDIEQILRLKPEITYEEVLLDLSQIVEQNTPKEKVKLNLSGWSEYPAKKLNDNHVKKVLNSFLLPPNQTYSQSQTEFLKFQEQFPSSLQYLDLNLYKLGFKNDCITQKSVDITLDTLLNIKSLKYCNLNLSSFGIINDYETKRFYKHSHVQKLTQFITQNPQLETFSLSARSWGYNNTEIKAESLIMLGEAISSLKNLKELELDLHCWAYQNNFDHTGTLKFLKSLSKLEKLNVLVLKLDFFNNLNYKHFIEIMNVIMNNPNLVRLQVSTLQSLFLEIEQNVQHKEKLLFQQRKEEFLEFLLSRKQLKKLKICLELIPEKKKYLLQKLLQQNQFRQTKINQFPVITNTPIRRYFRKEIVYEILEQFL